MTTKRRRQPGVETAMASMLPVIADQPWAMHLPVLRSMSRLARSMSALEPGDLRAAFGFGAASAAAAPSPVRIIPVSGPITNHSSIWSDYFGGASVDGLRRDLKAALDDATVKAVIFAIASPGGEVMGMTEFAKEIRAYRGGAKPIVAVLDPYAHSAAYWIASQCDEVVITPSGTAGSIGVYTIHEEYSQALEKAGITETVIGSTPEKTESLDVIPLSDPAEQAIREMVLAHAAMFTADVAAGRNVSPDAVNKTFGGGRVLMAKQALEVGMVDRVDTLFNTATRLARGTRAAGARAEADGPELVAGADAEDFDALPQLALPALPFSDRIARLAADADELVVHATERGRLRAKEGRPPFSNKNLVALRASHDAIGSLLSVVPDPAVEPPETPPAEAPVVEPPVVEATRQPAAAPAVRAPRFRSREEWLDHLQEVI